MIETDFPRVFLVADMRGYDDEGMKKISRLIAAMLQRSKKVAAHLVAARQAFDRINTVDILHYIGGPTYKSVLFTTLCKTRHKKLKTILTFVNPQLKLFGLLLIRLFKPDHIIVSSHEWQQWAARFGFSYSLISVSGVDLDRFRPVSFEQRIALRRKLNIPLNKTVILHVGHIKDGRNLNALLELQATGLFQVLVVGSTTTIQSEQLIHNFMRAGCIVIKSYQERIEEFYQAADCYVFPTMDQTQAVQIPLSVLEAMSVNLPVITTPFGGLPTFFPSGAGLCYFTSFEDLHRLVIYSLSHRVSTRSLVGAFSWDAIAARQQALYTALLYGRFPP